MDWDTRTGFESATNIDGRVASKDRSSAQLKSEYKPMDKHCEMVFARRQLFLCGMKYRLQCYWKKGIAAKWGNLEKGNVKRTHSLLRKTTYTICIYRQTPIIQTRTGP